MSPNRSQSRRTIYNIVAVAVMCLLVKVATAWSVTGHHPASMGHHALYEGHHPHLHHRYSHQGPSRYNYNSYSHDSYSNEHESASNSYSTDDEALRSHISAWQQQQREDEQQPPPFFAAVAAAAAYGQPALLDSSLNSAAAAAAGTEPAAAVAASAAADITATTTKTAAAAPTAVIIGPVSLAAAGFKRSNGLKAFNRIKGLKGPCSSLKTVYIVNVSSVADFEARTAVPPTSTVILYLKGDLIVPDGVLFDRVYSCTFLMSAKWPGYTLTGGNPMYPVLRVWSTHNFVSLNVNFDLPAWLGSPDCTNVPELGKNVSCPAISVYKSYGVQIGRGSVFGRIDVLRSMAVRIDSLKVTAVSVLDYEAPGAIRVAISGYGPGLIQSNIIISNNEVYGVCTPIMLHRGAIGVTVTNNYIHDYLFTGVRCGADVHYAGDCMLSRINSNLVVASGRNRSGDQDGTGFYFGTHWFSPGNSALCNYVFNGDHCFYLDYCTSGVLVRGGACVNTYDGMKVNNGKRNVIRDVAMKGTKGVIGWTTCFTVTVNNCLKDPGSYWEAMRIKYYNTDRINKLWPWMKEVCRETSANGGVPCNPPGGPSAGVTGKCSGLGSDNIIDLVAVNTTERGLGYKYCENYPVTAKLNRETDLTLRQPLAAGFQDFERNDLGLKKNSVIYKFRPKYLSCPRSLVGPRRFSQKSFLNSFNIQMPVGFSKVVGMSTAHIIDHGLTPRSVQARIAAGDREFSWLQDSFHMGS